MGTKALIVGSTGWIGNALLRELQSRGVFAVSGHGSAALDLTRFQAAEQLARLMDEETTLFVAARARLHEDRFKQFEDDVRIALSIAQSLSKHRVKKCIWLSTLSVYGDSCSDLEITEQTAIAPTSLYGTAKFAGECLIRQIAEDRSLPLVVLRPCKIYGPGDFASTYGPSYFIQSILRSGEVRLFGDGSELRDHVFLPDLVEILIQLAQGNHQGVFNVATGQSHSFVQILECLQGITNSVFAIGHQDSSRPKIDQRILPAKLLESLPGFQFTNLEEGLLETWKFFKDSLERT
jgi:UDP-glucose 4-epimerase